MLCTPFMLLTCTQRALVHERKTLTNASTAVSEHKLLTVLEGDAL